jgi:hypothetical protein
MIPGEDRMKISSALFTAFILLVAAETLGVGILSRASVDEVRTNVGVASLWLAWMFGLWGALTLCVVFTIAWVAEGMTDTRA